MSFHHDITPGDLSRSEPELYSSSNQSYNEWQYGDEASLYSIAEDSREYGSDVFSMAGNDAVMDIPTHVVETNVQWVDDDLDDEEIDSSGNRALGGNVHNLKHGWRMKFGLVGFLFLMAALAVLIGLLVSNSQDNPSPNGLEDEAEAPGNAPVALPEATISISPVSSPATSLPTENPSTQAFIPSPSETPTYSISYKLANSFVTSALNSCADADLFEDPATVQGKIFQKLVLELFEETTVDVEGYIYYPLSFGDAYIKEKFALEMLYVATNGDSWDNSIYWKTEDDPCAGWNGVQNCRTRREGSCGVIEIDLGTFSTTHPWTCSLFYDLPS